MGIKGSMFACILRPSIEAAESYLVSPTHHCDFVTTCRAVELVKLDSKVNSSFFTNLTFTHLLSSHYASHPSRTTSLDPSYIIPHSYLLSFMFSI